MDCLKVEGRKGSFFVDAHDDGDYASIRDSHHPCRICRPSSFFPSMGEFTPSGERSAVVTVQKGQQDRRSAQWCKSYLRCSRGLASLQYMYRDRLKVWWISFLLLLTTSASACPQHSCNLEHRLQPISVQHTVKHKGKCVSCRMCSGWLAWQWTNSTVRKCYS